jgi:putative phage-type endonuclease
MNAETKVTAATGLALLREPFPPHQISKLPKETKAQIDDRKNNKNGINCSICGGWHHPKAIHLDYVGHAALTDRLLNTDPNWTWEPVGFTAEGLPAYDRSGGLWIKLTVCGQTRYGFGAADGKSGGDAVKEMIGDALRNAAMRFGAALDLWHKGELHVDADDGGSDDARREKVDLISAEQRQTDRGARARRRQDCRRHLRELQGRVARQADFRPGRQADRPAARSRQAERGQAQKGEGRCLSSVRPNGSPPAAAKVTASRIADIMARTKSGYSTSRANYKAQLVCERLTSCVEPSYCNSAMQWGIDKEPEAREAYCRHQLCTVTEVGFVDHPTIPMAGASPDGLVGDDGLVEIKCPFSATHIDTLLGGGFDEKYAKQVQWQMACTERTWCDLVSYDPRLPDTMQLFVERIPRNEGMIAELEREITVFLAEVEETVSALQGRFGSDLKAQLQKQEAA